MPEVFPFTRSKLQRKVSSITLADRTLTVASTFFKTPIRARVDAIAGVVRIREVTSDPLLRREVRSLQLPAPYYADGNVAVLFREPVRIEKFKYGADKALAISAKERRRGAAVEMITFTLEDPDGFVSALSDKGVRRFDSVTQMQTDVIGLATGAVATQRQAEIERTRRRARLGAVGWGVALWALVVGRVAIGEDETLSARTIEWLAGAALVAAVLVGIGVGIATRARVRQGRQPVRDRVHGVAALVRVVAPLIALGGWFAAQYFVWDIGPDIPRWLAAGAVLGAPAGAIAGFALAVLGRDDRARIS